MAYVFYGDIPDRRDDFVDSVGTGFIIGLITGPAYHFVGGLRRGSPSGGGRLAAGIQAARAHGPRFAGWMGANSVVFFAVETAMSVARKREDDWNTIVAGATSFSLFQMHRGARAAALGAVIGAACVAVPFAQWSFLAQWHVSQPYVRKLQEHIHKIGP